MINAKHQVLDFVCRGAFGPVVARSTEDREIPGSNPTMA